MLIQQIVRTEPERVLINVKNVSASSITTGMGVCLALGNAGAVASADGVNAIIMPATPTAANGAQSFVGVAKGDIAVNGYGLVIAWGFADSILLSQETDKTIGVLNGQSLLQGGGAAGTFTSTLVADAVTTYAGAVVINAITTNISSALPYTKGFVRAL